MTALPSPDGGPARRGEASLLRRWLWPLVQATLFHWSLHSAYYFRNALLRRFGATLEGTVRIRRTSRIDRPWNLTMGRKSSLADGCILWCREPVTIGERSVVSQYSVLSTCRIETPGDTPTLHTSPITIGNDTWVAAECYVAAGTTLPDGACVAARSVIRDPLEPWTVCAGIPAKVRKRRRYGRA